MSYLIARASASAVSVAVLACCLLAGCKEKVSYAEPNVSAVKVQFGCDKSPKGDAADACRMLAAFDEAAFPTTWPKSGVDSWWGRKHCIDTLDAEKAMHFGRILIKPGKGNAQHSDAEQDPSRTLSYNASFPTISIGAASPDALEAYRRMLDATKKGTEPSWAGLDDFEISGPRSAWKAMGKDVVKQEVKLPLTRSDGGKTALSGNTLVDNPNGFVTSHNVRQKGDALYLLQPSTKSASCITEMYRYRPNAK